MYFQKTMIGGHKVHPMALRILYCAHQATIIHGREFVTAKEIDAVYLISYDKTISGLPISECKTRIHANNVLRDHGRLAAGGRLWGKVVKDGVRSHFWFITRMGMLVLDMLLNGGSEDAVLTESRRQIAQEASSLAGTSSTNNLVTLDATALAVETARMQEIVRNTNLPPMSRSSKSSIVSKPAKMGRKKKGRQTDQSGGSCMVIFVISFVALMFILASIPTS